MRRSIYYPVINVFCFLFLLLINNSTLWAADLEQYTFKLTQSNESYIFWTTTPSERVFMDSAIPSIMESTIKVYAARNEFEPFQVVVLPSESGTVTVQIGDFGSGIITEIYQVKYVNITQASDSLGQTGYYPDPLWPLNNGDSVSVAGQTNTAFWFSVSVAGDVTPGDYSASVQINNVEIPVSLHVYNFSIPDELHVKSQMNLSCNTILSKYGVSGVGDEHWIYVDMIKQYFIDHRLTLESVLWPGGLTSSGAEPYIDYNCTDDSLSDPYGIWGFEEPAERYLNGTGLMGGTFSQMFNEGSGFPSFMAATFKNNDSSDDQRPSVFCGITRSIVDWYTGSSPSSPYNQKWFTYITAIQDYLSGLDLLDKAYYYFANEPQDEEDYNAVAWYSYYLKNAAPNLKLMVSEEPKPEIYKNPYYGGSGQIDIWMPVLNNYDPEISHDRKKNHDESTWIYFLSQTKSPYYNPITLDHPGIESKFTGWLLWKYRIEGIAYYSLNDWKENPWTYPASNLQNGGVFMLYPPSEDNTNISYGSNNHRFVPSIRLELMRDSLEDYEYLWVLNGNTAPQVVVSSPADVQADKIIGSLTSYCRDSEFMYNVRRLIGLKNSGEISSIPDIHPQSEHSRAQGQPGNYYINFQDPEGDPSGTVVVDGKSYMKIGWDHYSDITGYGWYGENDHVQYAYLTGPNELQKSILYDDYGWLHTFEFDLPNGTYNVTVSVGLYGLNYDHHKIDVEGVVFIDDEATTTEQPYIVRTKKINITDNKLTMGMGVYGEYTMLNYIDIKAVKKSNMVPIQMLLLE